MKELTRDEILLIVTEKLLINTFEVLCIDCDDILISSTNDEFGLAWDVKTLRLEVYYDGYQMAWYNYKSEKGKENYDNLLIELKKLVGEDAETINEIKSAYTKYVLFERYEEAQLLTNFLNLIK